MTAIVIFVRCKTNSATGKKKYSTSFALRELIDTVQMFNDASGSLPSCSDSLNDEVPVGTCEDAPGSVTTASGKYGRKLTLLLSVGEGQYESHSEPWSKLEKTINT